MNGGLALSDAGFFSGFLRPSRALRVASRWPAATLDRLLHPEILAGIRESRSTSRSDTDDGE